MSSEYFDVVIVGAGLSGIGAACHLQQDCPDKSYTIIEARDAIGGTWDLFRYPGIRSDSDMHTLGYSFKPWHGKKAIADARLYVTARGIYEMYLNGARVGEDRYNPGLTQYNKTHMYQTYDVTDMVHSGANAMGAMLGEGWWSGLLSFGSGK